MGRCHLLIELRCCDVQMQISIPYVPKPDNTCHIFVGQAFPGILHNSVQSETKKAPKLNFLGKFCRQKSLLKF